MNIAVFGALLLLAVLVMRPDGRRSLTASAAMDTLTSIGDLHDLLHECEERSDRAAACDGVIYVWSPLMPLSRMGMVEIAAAADHLGLDHTIIGAPSIYALARSLKQGDTTEEAGPSTAEDSLAVAMIAAGATTHYPAVLLYRDGHLLPNAILGYKTAPAYQRMIENGMSQTPVALAARGSPATPDTVGDVSQPPGVSQPAATRLGAGQWQKDFAVRGNPGPYFRRVPSRNVIAYAARETVYLFDFDRENALVGPGYIDFVPSPDGRFFVTPGRGRGAALEFYDAARVFEAAASGTGPRLPPFYEDRTMRDQYPTVGILDTGTVDGTATTRYRVLTSWFDRVKFRDYDVRYDATGSLSQVRPDGNPVPACPDFQLSLPIMSPDGSMLAARDEATATTKLFRLHSDGGCDEVVDLQMSTGKVTFDPDSRRVAFAIPRGAVRDGTGTLWVGQDDSAELAGIFVFDPDDRRITRVRGSEEVNRLAFPEFVGRDSLMFLMSAEDRGASSRFRLVCCVR